MPRASRITLNALTVLSLLLAVAAVAMCIWTVRLDASDRALHDKILQFQQQQSNFLTDTSDPRFTAALDGELKARQERIALRSRRIVDESVSVAVFCAAVVLPLCRISIRLAIAQRRRAAERKDRLQGLCPSCHYNLTGNVSGICPECGAAIRQ